jgi:hypothetical protein
MNKNQPSSGLRPLGVSACMLLAALGPARAADGADDAAARLDALKRQVDEQTRRLDALKQSLRAQEAQLDEMRRALGDESLDAQRGGAGRGSEPSQLAQSAAETPQPVGQAAQPEARRPEVATIFEQPGVLTPKGKFVLEPSLQYAYSSSNRVALVGYTIIPAVLIGLIDIREVKRSTYTATLTGRYGLTNRFEIEARLPWVDRSDSSVGRELNLQGSATDSVFDTKGSGIGDVEVTARYQFNEGGLDKPYFVGSLRFKSRTGKDPFEVLTTRVGETQPTGTREGLQTELPTGSGFYGLQPALTVLYPSDPAVLFGTVSYLHSFKRNNVSLTTPDGPLPIGSVEPGGVFGFNFGMGLALNERSSFSIGYDHSSIGKTRQNGIAAPDAVRVQLGTLLLGYAYRLSPQRTLNVSIGAGLTRDTPDVTLTVRLPMTF